MLRQLTQERHARELDRQACRTPPNFVSRFRKYRGKYVVQVDGKVVAGPFATAAEAVKAWENLSKSETAG